VAEDAHVLDTSSLGIEIAVAEAIAAVERRLRAGG
jgi:cytidylate kinase